MESNGQWSKVTVGLPQISTTNGNDICCLLTKAVQPSMTYLFKNNKVPSGSCRIKNFYQCFYSFLDRWRDVTDSPESKTKQWKQPALTEHSQLLDPSKLLKQGNTQSIIIRTSSSDSVHEALPSFYGFSSGWIGAHRIGYSSVSRRSAIFTHEGQLWIFQIHG